MSFLNRERLQRLRGKVHQKQNKVISFIKKHRTIKVLHIFRSSSALIVVVSSAFLVSATNFAAGRESSGFLFGYFGSGESADNPIKDKFFVKTVKKTDIAVAPLAEPKTSPDPNAKDTENEPAITQGQALVASTSPVKKDPEEDGGVVIYEVQSGDTVSSIASHYKITVNTILWSNEMDNVDEIKPGDKIFILPVSGLSYTVQKGDDINSIANKFKADKGKIIAFNSLPANGELKQGEEIMIPDGQKELPKPAPSATAPLGIAQRPYESFQSAGRPLSGRAGTGHSFPYGYCTWYVAQKVYVPWGGNAGTWLYHAKSAGYSTGRTPRPGAIMVSSESWWGHVALVESVSGGSFTVSEMNYNAWAKRDLRTLSTSNRAIKGFIYTN